MSLNLVNLVGRAGRDPEIIHFKEGNVLCKIAIAVNRPTSKEDKPDWFDLEIWGKTAEVAANYVRKGSLIGIKGSLKIDSWSDPNTRSKRSKPIIKVDRLDLLGSRKDNEASGFSHSEAMDLE
jgi:single-strand DNA-binding protein